MKTAVLSTHKCGQGIYEEPWFIYMLIHTIFCRKGETTQPSLSGHLPVFYVQLLSMACDHKIMRTVSTQLLVWKWPQPSSLEYMQSTDFSTCNELCRYTSHLRYGILGQKGDTVFPGLSAAAVWLTAVARNLKVIVSFLSDSVNPMGIGLPLDLLLFGSTTIIAQFEKSL